MSARQEAERVIQEVRDFWYPVPVPPSVLIDALGEGDLLHRLADERRMTNQDTK